MDTEAPQQPAQQQIQITNANMLIPFSDLAFIRPTENGVVFDFAQMNGTPQAPIVSRVGLSIDHAKRFLKALQDVLAGVIPPVSPSGGSSQASTGEKGFGFSVDSEKPGA